MPIATVPMERRAPSRRDRQRASTEAEIKAVARRQLAELGPTGVSLRGIARDMGMTAPGLYRYFASLDDLQTVLCCDFFAEATTAVDAAIAEAGDDLGARMHAAIRGFRRWAVARPAEFALMFRSADGPDGHDHGAENSRQFASLFLDLFVRVWEQRPLDLPDIEPVAMEACKQLETFARKHEIDLPPDALWAFASAWARLYGIICMDVFGQLAFMFDDVEPYFEAELAAVAGALGLPYVPQRSL